MSVERILCGQGLLNLYQAHAEVQGEAAPAAIVAALTRASARADCDVLLLVRGGGSLEDLQAFNDENVARAIVASRVPVVSGVGHEVDVTIADFAADMRAATPSAAAELVCPDISAQRQALPLAIDRLGSRMRARLAGDPTAGVALLPRSDRRGASARGAGHPHLRVTPRRRG